jgi:hypothetical protein
MLWTCRLLPVSAGLWKRLSTRPSRQLWNMHLMMAPGNSACSDCPQLEDPDAAAWLLLPHLHGAAVHRRERADSLNIATGSHSPCPTCPRIDWLRDCGSSIR